jgi:hypothetical protein
MLVGKTSGIATSRTIAPAGENSVILPVVRVATTMLPLASTARLSKPAGPGGAPPTTRPLCAKSALVLARTPGASMS